MSALEVLLWVLAVLAAAVVAFIIAAMVSVVLEKTRDAERAKLQQFHRWVHEEVQRRGMVTEGELEAMDRELWGEK